MATTTVTPPPPPSIRVSGGDPAGFPGYRPLNPWGRPMPKPDRPPPPPRYQVYVERRDPISSTGWTMIPFGPKADDKFVEPLCLAIEEAIAAGSEKDLRNPHVVRLL